MADDTKDQSVDDIIKDSIEEVDKSTLPSEDEEEEEPKEEEEVETEDEEKDENDLSDEEKIHALNLFKALKDPDQRVPILRVIAGDLINKVDTTVAPTKTEKKEITEIIQDIVSKNLGDNYKFLAKGISGAIKEALDVVIEEKTSGIRTEIESSKRTKLQETVDSAMTFVFSRYSNIDEKVQKQILKMMDTVKPSQNADPKEYFESLAHGAASRLGIQLKLKGSSSNGNTEGRTKVINRNRNDASLRLASERGGNPHGTVLSTDKVSIDEAVKRAVAAVEKQK